jgi:hypothetical protein
MIAGRPARVGEVNDVEFGTALTDTLFPDVVLPRVLQKPWPRSLLPARTADVRPRDLDVFGTTLLTGGVAMINAAFERRFVSHGFRPGLLFLALATDKRRIGRIPSTHCLAPASAGVLGRSRVWGPALGG